MTTNRLDLIEPEDFIQQILEKSAPTYVYHVIMIEGYPLQVHPSQMTQILAATAKIVTLPEVYKDFEDVFST